MGRWTAERWAASTGIGFVIVLVIGNLLPGSPKKYNASAASIVGYLQDKHKELLIAGVLYGIGAVLFLWFLASFAGLFREAGQRRLSTIMYGAGVATVTLGALGDAVGISLARLVYWTDPKTIRALYGLTWFIYGRLYWTLTALALATVLAVRRSKVLPEWYAWLTLVGAVLFVLGGLSEKTKGFFSPSGGMPMIAFIGFLVWILVSSILLVQRTAEAPMGAPATSPM